MAKAPNIVPLKLLVISLGLLLAGGTVFVISALVEKAGRLQPAPCSNVSLSLASLLPHGRLLSVTPQEKMLLVTAEDGTATQVLTLDRCNGKLLQQFTITP